jgi:hypothetical protein
LTPASSTRRSLTWLAAVSISSDHLRQPVAALLLTLSKLGRI